MKYFESRNEAVSNMKDYALKKAPVKEKNKKVKKEKDKK